MNRRTGIVLLLVVSAGCLSAPSSITEPTEPNSTTEPVAPTESAGISLEAYPASVSGPPVIVAPQNRSDVIARSVVVLQSHLQQATNASPRVVSHSAFDPQNSSGTAIVLAPEGRLPDSLAGTFDAPESTNETTATVFTANRSAPGVSDFVVLSGGDWGIRAGVDDLTGRTDVSLSGQRATTHAEINTYEGEVVKGRYAELYALLLETDDDTYILTASPEILDRNEPTNVTVRAYNTEFRQPVLGSNRIEPTTMTAPGLEIVSVIERDNRDEP